MRRWALLAGLMGVTAAGAVSAQMADGLTMEQASVLAGPCANCHGTTGNAPGPTPSIAGLSTDAIVAMMNAFKADQVPGATIMGRIARGYNDEQILAVARFFSGYWN